MHQQPRATEHPLALNRASRSGQRFEVSGNTVSFMRDRDESAKTLALYRLEVACAAHLIFPGATLRFRRDGQHLLVPVFVGALELLEDRCVLQPEVRVLGLVLGEVREVLGAARANVLPVALAGRHHVLGAPEHLALDFRYLSAQYWKQIDAVRRIR